VVQKAGTKRSERDEEKVMPALPSNCYKTPHGYLFRIVVPEPLRAAVGKCEIKKALGKDYRQAVSQARVLAVQVDRQFESLRQQSRQQEDYTEAFQRYVAQAPNLPLKAITKVTPELVSALRSLWLSTLEADLAWRREGVDEEDYQELQENIQEVQAKIAQALARGQPKAFVPAIRTLLVGKGYQLAVSPEEERQLVLDVLPALQEGYDILAQRQAGRLVQPNLTLEDIPLRAVWEPRTPSTPSSAGLSWQGLLEHWRQDCPRNARTDLEVQRLVQSLSTFFPKATPATLTRGQVTDWLRNEREQRGNSAKTLEKKGTLVGALFSITVKDELLEKNPFSGFDYKRFATKEGLASESNRSPFTQRELTRIFSNDGLFGVSKRTGGGGYHARIWIPLIALYSGARLDEIGPLTVDEIVLQPVPYFKILKAKNQGSIRDVPIHPKLIELGFLDYVEAIRASGHTRLWPFLLTGGKVNSDSEVLGRWFNRFIHHTLGLRRNVSFHSFRHSFKDFCRNALIPRELHHALTGHATPGQVANVGDSYGEGYSIEVKAEQLAKINPGIKIPKPQAFTGKLEVELMAAGQP
jgi:integrase